MSLTRLYPAAAASPDPVDLDADGARQVLAELYRIPRPSWLRINLVASVNGSAAGTDGTSNTLTSRTDRKILGAIRRLSDVVLVGASSVRAEGYLLPRTAPLAVVTGSGDLSGHRIPADVAPGRLIVLCPQSALPTVHASLGGASAEIIPVPGGGALDPGQIVRSLRERGLASIVCEGGPQLAVQLVNAGLVDEVCLTTSPVLSGMRLPMLGGVGSDRRLSLAQLLVDEADALYARWMLPAR